MAGESGIKLIDRFDTSELTTKFGGQIRGFESNGYIDRKTDKRLDDCQRYCIVAWKKALENAALGEQEQRSKVCNLLINDSVHYITFTVYAFLSIANACAD